MIPKTKCANSSKGNHNYSVRPIDDIHHILCHNRKDGKTCDYPMVQLFCNGFLGHISEENMARLATRLIEKQPLTKAELALAEQVKEVIFA